MRIVRLALLSISCLIAAACGDSPTAEEQHETEIATATISFDADWNESVDGRLVDGGRLVIDYDDERVAPCKATQGGVPQYAVTAHYTLDGGETESLIVAGLQAAERPTIELDGAGELEIWFEVTNRWGCHEWDSDFGSNYSFDVDAE